MTNLPSCISIKSFKSINTDLLGSVIQYEDSDKCGITSIYKSCICTCWDTIL